MVVLIVLIGAFFRLFELATAPPSAGFDVAYYGLDALEILDGHFPIYFESNFGREPLFSYLVAALFATIGSGDFAIHLAAAFVGILTIPVTFVAADELLRLSSSRPLRLSASVLAAAFLALMYWHVVWSRFGVRAILSPLFVGLTVFSLLRALRTRRLVYFVSTGVLTGLSLYTYQIGQLVPLLVFVIVIIDWIAQRKKYILGEYFKPIAWIAAVFALFVSPLILFAANNPDTFNQRVRDVTTVEASMTPGAIIVNLRTQLEILGRFFTIQGDHYWMWSIGEKPGLNVFLLIGFLLGLLLLWYWRGRLAPVIFAWLLVMLIPAILADSGAMSKRAIGILPALVTTIAVGWLTPFIIAVKRPGVNRRLVGRIATALILFGLLFTLADTYQNYFVVWANDPAKDGEFDPHLSEIGRYIALLPPGERIYLSADAPNHPNMLLHSKLRTDSDDARGYNGWHCFVFPEETTQPTTYVLSEELSLEQLQRLFPGGHHLTTGLSNKYGYADYYTAYQVAGGQHALFQPQNQIGVSWENKITLAGYDLPRSGYSPGDTVDISLYWSADKELDERITVFVHLLGQENPQTGNTLWGQYDSEPCKVFYPTAVWREDEIVQDRIAFEISPEAPPGIYQLVVGLYTWPSFERLTVNGSDSLRLQNIEIAIAEE